MTRFKFNPAKILVNFSYFYTNFNKMSYRHTLEAALESLQDIEELIKGFPDDGEVPSIEVDLTLQKLRNIYELLLVLKKPAGLSIEQSAVVPSAPAVPPVAPPAAPPVAPPVSAPVPAPQADQPKATRVESLIDKEIVPSSKVPEPKVEPPRQPVAGHKDAGEAQILSDRFKGRATLHESLHQSMGNDAQFHTTGKPVENLMSAIAINDRFTFIRELFNGDSPAFEQAIKALNEAANFNDAYNYMIQHYDWDMDSEAVQLLLDIIRRKYIISRHE
jgi:hypothetical protein